MIVSGRFNVLCPHKKLTGHDFRAKRPFPAAVYISRRMLDQVMTSERSESL
jgi:hypothetical protein